MVREDIAAKTTEIRVWFEQYVPAERLSLLAALLIVTGESQHWFVRLRERGNLTTIDIPDSAWDTHDPREIITQALVYLDTPPNTSLATGYPYMVIGGTQDVLNEAEMQQLFHAPFSVRQSILRAQK